MRGGPHDCHDESADGHSDDSSKHEGRYLTAFTLILLLVISFSVENATLTAVMAPVHLTAFLSKMTLRAAQNMAKHI